MDMQRISTLAVTLMVITLMFIGAAGSAPGWAAERFFAAIEDLPVMPGLEQVPDAGVSFDKPQGRIVEAAASGDVTQEAVQAFYTAVLPQLGWDAAGEGRYLRDGERLVLSLSASGRTLTVRFSLFPD
jgi:hypothetical protein